FVVKTFKNRPNKMNELQDHTQLTAKVGLKDGAGSLVLAWFQNIPQHYNANFVRAAGEREVGCGPRLRRAFFIHEP
ncbi:MAG: hypothetical protein ACREJ2_01875, partial [Planctomycetota bacterium]